ncbi:hypothetical protein K490DRAFT_20349, partial [Saccharata proteae CBS 121410]
MVEVLQVPDASDGNAGHRPDPHAGYFRIAFPENYLIFLGECWARHTGTYNPGRKYTLDRLPPGYVVYAKNRANSKHVDKYLYGHPAGSNKAYRSVNEFLPHFLHLMDFGGDDSAGCSCRFCGRSASTARSASTSKKRKTTHMATNHPVRPIDLTGQMDDPGKPRDVALSSLRTDEEGTPDIYRNLIDNLKRYGYVDQPIKETMSLDWRAENEVLPSQLDQYRQQEQWIPRLGEIVLYNKQRKERTGHPNFEAGVVTQVPTEKLNIYDAYTETPKQSNVTHSGFRVEPLPDPNGTDKALSKQHKYLPMRQIRPFIFWKEYLKKIPEEEWHPTIKNALTAMSTFTLIRKEHFKGRWPSASITCGGIYIGSELILPGDVVRLTPQTRHGTVVDCLQITSIKLTLSNLDTASDDDYDRAHPYSSTVHITGKGYTCDVLRGHTKFPLRASSYPTILANYADEWWSLHEPDKSIRIPFHRVMGRLFEGVVMVTWLPQDLRKDEPQPKLRHGIRGLEDARNYSVNNYIKCIAYAGKCWFWADTRAEALDVETINDHKVGSWDETLEQERNKAQERKLIKILEG